MDAATVAGATLPKESGLVEELRHAVERAEQQPEDEQRRIAQLILDELEDQAWEQSSVLHTALAEARAQLAAGDLLDYEDYARSRRQPRA